MRAGSKICEAYAHAIPWHHRGLRWFRVRAAWHSTLLLYVQPGAASTVQPGAIHFFYKQSLHAGEWEQPESVCFAACTWSCFPDLP